jgi:hypothetical protein
MNLSQIAAHRLYQHYLSRPTLETAADVVSWLGAVQAQDYPGGKWAVAQRTSGWTNAAVDDAFAKGEILRTHVLRPTWHFVVPEDLRWMLSLTAYRVNTAMGYYYRTNELDDALFTRCNTLIGEALTGGKQLTKAELQTVLAEDGIAADMARLGLILLRAELDQVVVSGAWQGKQQMFALFDERVPPLSEPGRDEALAMLTLRYFRSHGPATMQDYQWWSGLTMADVRAGVEMVKAQLQSATIADQTYWFHETVIPPPDATPMVHLLPNYDEYLVAYVDRTAAYAGRTGRIENILFHHTIVIDGKVVGLWKPAIKKQKVTVTAEWFRSISDGEMEAYHVAVRRYGAFLGVEVVIM